MPERWVQLHGQVAEGLRDGAAGRIAGVGQAQRVSKLLGAAGTQEQGELLARMAREQLEAKRRIQRGVDGPRAAPRVRLEALVPGQSAMYDA
jgi:hypothetical protein